MRSITQAWMGLGDYLYHREGPTHIKVDAQILDGSLLMDDIASFEADDEE